MFHSEMLMWDYLTTVNAVLCMTIAILTEVKVNFSELEIGVLMHKI